MDSESQGDCRKDAESRIEQERQENQVYDVQIDLNIQERTQDRNIDGDEY
jgi:hypothetical protein